MIESIILSAISRMSLPRNEVEVSFRLRSDQNTVETALKLTAIVAISKLKSIYKSSFILFFFTLFGSHRFKYGFNLSLKFFCQ